MRFVFVYQTQETEAETDPHAEMAQALRAIAEQVEAGQEEGEFGDGHWDWFYRET